MPGVPVVVVGGTRKGDALIRERAWRQLLKLLDGLKSG
jgi:hypothetical protein